MLAAGIGLVTTRLYLGRGGALLAVLGYVLIRTVLSVMVGGVWGQTTPHFPLYIVEALLVEAVFARAGGRCPVVNSAIAGALIGTIGLAAEWAWTHVSMPDSVERLAAARGGDRRDRHRGGRRRGRRLHRRFARRPQRRTAQPRGRAPARKRRPSRRARGRARRDGRDRLGASAVDDRRGARTGGAEGPPVRQGAHRSPRRSGWLRAARWTTPTP